GGALATLPLIALVTEDGTPLAGEGVTFTVGANSGAIGGSPGTLAATFGPVFTDVKWADGVPSWGVGSGADPQTVTSSIASGSPASVTFDATIKQAPPKVLPVINTIWPANATKVSLNNAATRDWFTKPRVELTFSKGMNATDLDTPGNWLRIF